MKNLDGNTPVTLRLQGKDMPGIAAPCADNADSQQVRERMYPRVSAEKAAELVMIEVRL